LRTLICTCVVVLTGIGGLASAVCAQHHSLGRLASRHPSDGDGRATGGRDPFVRPTAESDEANAAPPDAESPPLPRLEGLSALSRSEITVRGVLKANGRNVALVQGPDRKHHAIRPGDRLRDGVVLAVTPGGLVMVANEKTPAGDEGGQLWTPTRAQREGH
jgi:hypothetical protein